MSLTVGQRRALGEFLRRQRSRLAPASLGLPMGSRRRTPGLRREEVAQLAGISATWYSWIEQGRDVSVSPAALGRLAQALLLSPAERRYLFDLAAKLDPRAPEGAAADLPPGFAAALEQMQLPAYALDRQWRALAWNAAAARLFVGWLDEAGERNLLRYIFLSPAARTLICDWEERARRALAEFRAELSRYIDDPELRALVAELCRESPFFAQEWERHAVVARIGGERTFRHPQDGFLRYEQTSLALAGRPEIKLVLLASVP